MEQDTRDSLLDAAERLFSEHGIEAASLRAITGAAGANLAAVHYHFGSKIGLVRAVFARRIRPLNEERLRRLEEERVAGSGIEGVARAFVEPMLRMAVERPDGACTFARMIGQSFGEAGSELRNILIEEFGDTIARFTAALAEQLPGLPHEDLLWRFHFMAGAMAHTVARRDLLEHFSGGLCRVAEVDRAVEHMVQFLAAGLRAPAVAAAMPTAPSPVPAVV
jgi:AcrR family transcriptional regulator